MKVKYSFFLILTLFALILGCGADEGSAPPNSTITINPSSMDVTDDSTEVSTHYAYFTIYVTDSNGIPIQDAQISIFYPWAVPDPAGVVQLYDGTTPVDSPFDAYTNSDGVYVLMIRYLSGGGYNYEGDLEVYSGSAYATASITVSGTTTTTTTQ